MVLLLAGCATEGKFREKLQTYVGTDVNSAIEHLGPPTSVYTMPNGNKSYTWMRSAGSMAMASYNPYGYSAYGTSFMIYCKVTMTANASNEIINWHYEGNQCVSR